MSERHVDRTYDRLLAGEVLSPDEQRHVATCGACQRAAAEVSRLDEQLRQAARGLASEPIPDDVLDADPMVPTVTERFGANRMGLASAAIVLVLVVSAGLLLARRPPAVGIDPSATPAPSQVISVPSPTPEPSGPPPTPAPTPGVPSAGADLVGPLDTCADGVAGFSVVLPEGWYANRRQGEQLACRAIGSIRMVEDRPQLDPAISISVDEAPPDFGGATLEDEARLTAATGVSLDRYVVKTPESGALAAAHEVVYVAQLLEGGYLTATTDADQSDFVAGLDALMNRLELTQPITISPLAASAADGLFADRDACIDNERGLIFIYPDAWWTNTAVDDLDACSWFAPTSFAFVSSNAVPDEIEMTVSTTQRGVNPIGAEGWETLTVSGRAATRAIVGSGPDRSYQYLVALSDPSVGDDLTLLARTVLASDSGDFDLAMALLDRLVSQMSVGALIPVGADSELPPISAPPATATATQGDLRLDITVDQGRYRAGQPIFADATLVYLGSDPSVTLWGSGSGIVGSGVRQLDGPFAPFGAGTTDCVAYELERGVPLHVTFVKSGGWDGDDPMADVYEAYFRDPLLRLSAGRWRISFGVGGTIGGNDCGDGPQLSLTASVEIVVEP